MNQGEYLSETPYEPMREAFALPDVTDTPEDDAVRDPEATSPEAAHGDEERPMATDLYLYEDYRRFLKDRFDELQARDPAFSQRGLSRKAGIANPGFFNEVIKGRRRLSPAATEKMAKGLTLSPADAKYLALLVMYNDTRDARAKQVLCQQLIFRRNRKFLQRLGKDKDDARANPLHSVIREAVAACDFRGDFEKLGRFVWPPVPGEAAEECVLELCEWGLVGQDGEGWRKLDGPAPWEGVQDAMDIHVHPPQMGHFSSEMVAVSEDAWSRLAEVLAETREKLLDIVRQDPSPAARVVQLNLQMIPRSWLTKEDEKDEDKED